MVTDNKMYMKKVKQTKLTDLDTVGWLLLLLLLLGRAMGACAAQQPRVVANRVKKFLPNKPGSVPLLSTPHTHTTRTHTQMKHTHSHTHTHTSS